VHELHRPLHRISQNIDEPNNHEAIAELRSIVDALDGVTHGRELEVSEVDVNEVFMSLRRQYAQYLADFGVRFDLSGELNLNVHVGAFKLVMKNLFLNALEEAAKLPPP